MVIQFLLTILLIICAVVAAMALLPPQRQRPPDERSRDGGNRPHDWNARDWDDVDPGNKSRNGRGFSRHALQGPAFRASSPLAR